MKGHAGHRNRRAGRGTACRERDVEQTRRALGIAIEQLVKIPHAIEQQDVAMIARHLGLEREVLLHHRGVTGLIDVRPLGGAGQFI